MIRDQPEAPLLLVTPADSAETLLTRALQSGATRVQLLVPAGVTTLGSPSEAARLAEGALRMGLELLLISGDPATLAVARQVGLPALEVVSAPPALGAPGGRAYRPARTPPPAAMAHTADTLPISALPPAGAPSSPPVRDEPPAAPPVVDAPPAAAAPVRDAPRTGDTDFLAALDNLEAPRATPEEDLAAAEASLAAALSPPGPTRPVLSDDDLLAATLGREPGMTPPRAARPPASSPRAPAPAPQAAPPPDAPAQRRAPTRGGGRLWPIIALTATLLGLLAIIGVVLLVGSRVTVTVTPPERPETIEQITALPVPLASAESAAGTAVAAEALREEVEYSVEGEVTEGTMTPSGSAGGVITIFNSTQQAVLLPAGTEFIAIRADGQEVPFLSLEDVLVPAATTSDTGAQVITSRGQASVSVQARSAGSGSNVDSGSVRRITPPGGAPFSVGTGGFLVQHGPLTGGSEEEVRIVKDSDAETLLAPALEGLDSEARRRLDELARARGLSLEPSTITPRRADLEQLRGFETLVQPAIGQSLDPAFPRFNLIVRAQYGALAIAPDRPIELQLGPALTEQLRQAGRLVPGDCRAPAVTDWRWDGESLLVDGQIAPDTLSPGCTGGLDAAVLEQVRAAVRGKSRAEAEAALNAMVAAGLIGGFTLPEDERMPGWDWQIQVEG